MGWSFIYAFGALVGFNWAAVIRIDSILAGWLFKVKLIDYFLSFLTEFHLLCFGVEG